MTKIEWTDKVWNPVTGCTKVSDGCLHCYAEAYAKRFWKGRGFNKITCHPDRLNKVFRLTQSKIFVNSMGDLFHQDVPFEFIEDVFITINLLRHHTFQILTKRAERMSNFIKVCLMDLGWDEIPKNIWLGVTVENQAAALERIPKLLSIPAAVRFISIEPMLEPINLSTDLWIYDLDWVIVGCETGPHKRPCSIEWIEDVVNQCRRTNTPVFVKQMNINGKVVKDPEQFPEYLRVREFPKNKG